MAAARFEMDDKERSRLTTPDFCSAPRTGKPAASWTTLPASGLGLPMKVSESSDRCSRLATSRETAPRRPKRYDVLARAELAPARLRAAPLAEFAAAAVQTLVGPCEHLGVRRDVVFVAVSRRARAAGAAASATSCGPAASRKPPTQSSALLRPQFAGFAQPPQLRVGSVPRPGRCKPGILWDVHSGGDPRLWVVAALAITGRSVGYVVYGSASPSFWP